jgi:UDP-3-O-[3-hydroxymyristoyl] glucosamine N-acyltransferase
MSALAPPLPAPPVGVHPSASVAESASLGAGVAIGPNVVIEAGARVGAHTILHAGVSIGQDSSIGDDGRLWNNVVVREGCHIGDRVVIQPNAVIGADGFGYYHHEGRHRHIPHTGRVIIGDDVEIGACSCVDRSKTGDTVIGSGTKIDNLVQVAHNVVIGENCLLCAQVGVAGSAVLGQYVVLGGHVGIRDNIVLHDGVMVGACSCVPQDVPAGTKVTGIPAVESRQFLREHATMRKLPALISQVRELAERVKSLEAAADD